MSRLTAPLLVVLLLFSGCAAKADNAAQAPPSAPATAGLPALPDLGGRFGKLEWLVLPELRVGLAGKAQPTDVQRRVSDTAVMDSYETPSSGISLYRGGPDTRWDLADELRSKAAYLHGTLDHLAAQKVAGRPAVTARIVYVRADNDTTETMNVTAVDCGPLMTLVFLKFAGTQGEVNPALGKIVSTLAFTSSCAAPAA